MAVFSRVYSEGENMKHVPLIYTLGMIQFPKVPGMERFIDPFLDKIRNEFPLVDEVKLPVFDADLGPQGIQIAQHENQLWQFMSIDRKWGFILSEQSLCLHTVSYRDFLNFSNAFLNGIEALLSVSGIGIDWITALGLRYVNLVASTDSHSLNDYLNPSILPPDLPSTPLSIIEGAYIARYKTTMGELRLQSMRNPQYTLPPELQSPLIGKNGWIYSRPDTDFALIDIDHGTTFSPPINIQAKDVRKRLNDLHDVSKAIFIFIGTELSHKIWR